MIRGQTAKQEGLTSNAIRYLMEVMVVSEATIGERRGNCYFTSSFHGCLGC